MFCFLQKFVTFVAIKKFMSLKFSKLVLNASHSIMQIIFLVAISTITSLKSQNKESFEKTYSEIYLKIAPNNFEKALKLSDSLYRNSPLQLQKTKSLMLSASLYQQSGDFNLSVEKAEKALEMIEENTDYAWKARIIGFLTSQYRLIGLNDKAKELAKLGITTANKIKDVKQKSQLLGLMHQEVAYTKLAKYQYKSAENDVKLSIFEFSKNNTPPINFSIATSYQMLGDINIRLEKYDLAKNYYKKSLQLNPTDNFISSLSYLGLGEISYLQKDWKNANNYLQKALTYAEGSHYLELKKDVYNKLKTYYNLVNNQTQEALYLNKYIKITEEILTKNNNFISNSYQKLDHNNSNYEKQVSYRNTTIILIIGFGIILFLFAKKQDKKQSLKTRNCFQCISENLTPKKGIDDHEKVKTDFYILPETECKILTQLKEFENGTLFNNKNMSLSYLAAKLNTNTKYLSHVINQHKKEDFKNYINRLRINYIINKLHHEPNYRKYKISTLSDECGFSSHSKFTTIFKSITGVSPSCYIKSLTEKEKTT